jgi:uncharacterized protein YigA (DUF484 family)
MSDHLDATQIADFLRGHPSFLAERPELYRTLTPPQRVHGENMADHMAAMVRAERAHAAAMQERAAKVLQAGRVASGIAERVHEAVLSVIRAPDPADWVTDVLPALLGLDAAALCCEGFRPRWRSLPPGAVGRLLGGKPVVFRDRPADAVVLHAEAALLAERDVLVRLPGPAPALLALVSRDAGTLPGLQGTQAFAFLGRVLAALTGC